MGVSSKMHGRVDSAVLFEAYVVLLNIEWTLSISTLFSSDRALW
jgi:hypothetical protein